MTEHPSTLTRDHPMPGQQLYHLENFEDDYQESDPPQRTKVDYLADANLISSQVEPLSWLGDNIHKPVLDLDVPAKLIPSSTAGHFHLYIDREMSWDHYKLLLETLGTVGILEPGYVSASLEREATFVRLPWIKKDA